MVTYIICHVDCGHCIFNDICRVGKNEERHEVNEVWILEDVPADAEDLSWSN